MTDEATTTQKLKTLTPVFCPHTGKRIVAEYHERFDIPNGRVTWFHCEACRGWHIIIDDIRPPDLTTPSSKTDPP